MITEASDDPSTTGKFFSHFLPGDCIFSIKTGLVIKTNDLSVVGLNNGVLTTPDPSDIFFPVRARVVYMSNDIHIP